MGTYGKTYSGVYTPQNPLKYKGNPTNIVWRSSWERKFMRWLDTHPDCIWWKSEETIIPYKSPFTSKVHRYFPDFVANLNTRSGERIFMIEIKPLAKTLPPKEQKITRKQVERIVEYKTNLAKWDAATRYCQQQGWEFKILTENDLNIVR